MPEENTGTEEKDEKSQTEETEEGDKTSQKNEGEDGDADTDEGQKETEEEGKTETEDEFEPEVRKRDKKDFIIERLQKKKEKLQSKVKEDEGEEEEDEDLKDYKPEDVSAVEKIIDKKLGPISQKVNAEEGRAEVNDFLEAKPDYKPYKSKMLKYRLHPAYEQVPIENIASIVAGNDLQKLGAQKAAEAEEEAKQAQMGGGSARGKTGEKKGVWDMSSEEFGKDKLEKLKQTRENE